jgi:hypothetical protein
MQKLDHDSAQQDDGRAQDEQADGAAAAAGEST